MSAIMTDELTHAERIEIVNDILQLKSCIKGKSGTDDYGVYPETDGIPENIKRAKQRLNNIKNQKKYENVDGGHYGFFDKKGNWISVRWGEHTIKAWHIIQENKLYHDEFRAKDWSGDNSFSEGSPTDFLVYFKGWILVHNPSNNEISAQYEDSKINKKQRNALYDFFITMDMHKEANTLFEELN